MVFESDGVGAECVESSNRKNLGKGLGYGSSQALRRLSSGEKSHCGETEYFCEWVESSLAKVIRETPRFELVHVC